MASSSWISVSAHRKDTVSPQCDTTKCFVFCFKYVHPPSAMPNQFPANCNQRLIKGISDFLVHIKSFTINSYQEQWHLTKHFRTQNSWSNQARFFKNILTGVMSSYINSSEMLWTRHYLTKLTTFKDPCSFLHTLHRVFIQITNNRNSHFNLRLSSASVFS